MLCYVEDICWGGSEQFQSTIIGKIREIDWRNYNFQILRIKYKTNQKLH